MKKRQLLYFTQFDFYLLIKSLRSGTKGARMILYINIGTV